MLPLPLPPNEGFITYEQHVKYQWRIWRQNNEFISQELLIQSANSKYTTFLIRYKVCTTDPWVRERKCPDFKQIQWHNIKRQIILVLSTVYSTLPHWKIKFSVMSHICKVCPYISNKHCVTQRSYGESVFATDCMSWSVFIYPES